MVPDVILTITFEDATCTQYYGQNNIWHVRRKRAAHINREKNVALPTYDLFSSYDSNEGQLRKTAKL
jgi:hypothetical protein